MTFVNLTVQGSHRRYIPWTVIESLSGKTFSGLFEEILAGDHPRLIVNKELSRCTLNIGQSKDSLSAVDEQLFIEDVCKLFGQYTVVLKVTEYTESSSQVLTNDFTVLMTSQREMSGNKREGVRLLGMNTYAYIVLLLWT